jgi:ferredoxin
MCCRFWLRKLRLNDLYARKQINASKEEKNMKGFVDKDTCIGCGLCPGICPEIFEMDDDGKAKASDEEISDKVVDDAKDAEAQCPVNAIKVE